MPGNETGNEIMPGEEPEGDRKLGGRLRNTAQPGKKDPIGLRVMLDNSI